MEMRLVHEKKQQTEAKYYKYLLIPVLCIIFEVWSCDGTRKYCMLGNCNDSQSQDLSGTEFIPKSNVSSNSNSDNGFGSDVTIKFFLWHKIQSGYLSKM